MNNKEETPFLSFTGRLAICFGQDPIDEKMATDILDDRLALENVPLGREVIRTAEVKLHRIAHPKPVTHKIGEVNSIAKSLIELGESVGEVPDSLAHYVKELIDLFSTPPQSRVHKHT